MCLGIGVCITHGFPVFGSMDAEVGDVLYLALEDQWRRLKSRYEQMTEKLGHNGGERFSFQTHSPRLGQGFEDQVEEWVKNAENPRLIIVDTIGKVRPKRTKTDDMYVESYDDMGSLKELADDLGIGVLGIHHTRKTGAEDALEEVLGSTGFTGASDSIWVLKRKRGEEEGVLLVTGRDVEECSMFLTFDSDDGLWKMSGKGGYSAGNPGKDAIVEWALASDTKVFNMKDVSNATGMSQESARMNLQRLAREGKLVRVRAGAYRLPRSDEGIAKELLEEE